MILKQCFNRKKRFGKRLYCTKVEKKEKRIFSGIQPTGRIHLGNYLGAIDNWIKLQNDANNSTIYCVVDLHSLTTEAGRINLEENVRNTTATLLACGIDPQKSILFAQSQVVHHAELLWILSCYTPMHTMNSMIQYKEKSRQQTEAGVGLFTYPILMASDILLYKTTHVPVGEDQTQHLEFSRLIAQKLNRLYGDVFIVPETIEAKFNRVMSIRDVKKKMSKSDPNEKSRIDILDTPDLIKTKILKAVTDSIDKIYYDEKERPQLANLFNIYSSLSKKKIEEIEKQFSNKNVLQFKESLIDVIVESLNPIQNKYNKIMKDPSQLDAILKQGSDKAITIASQTMRELKNKIGLL